MPTYTISYLSKPELFKIQQVTKTLKDAHALIRFVGGLRRGGATDVVWTETPVDPNGSSLAAIRERENELIERQTTAINAVRDIEHARHTTALLAARSLYGVTNGSIVLSRQRLYVVEGGWSWLTEKPDLDEQPVLMARKVLKSGKLAARAHRILHWTPVAPCLDALPENLRHWG